jgi:hypothetical protein
MDSHAVFGPNCYVFEKSGRSITSIRTSNDRYEIGVIRTYDQYLDSSGRKVVSERDLLLIVHQGLYTPHLKYSFIRPFQMEENDFIVNNLSKFLPP